MRLGERRVVCGLHQDIWAKPLDIEPVANDLTEPRNRLRRDEGERKGVEDAAALPDYLRPSRAEF